MQRKFYEKNKYINLNNQIGNNLLSFDTIPVAFRLRAQVLEAWARSSLQQHC